MKNCSNIKLLIATNLGLGLLFTLSLLAQSVWIQALPGFLVFLLPGFNLTLILSAITKQKLTGWQFFLWIVLFSPINLSIFSYLSIVSAGQIFNPQTIINFHLIVAGLSFILAFISCLTLKTPILSKPLISRPIIYTFSIFLVFQLGQFVLYRYLPEADPYRTLIDVEQAIRNGALIDSTRRVLFEPLILGLYSLTGIAPYWLYKIFFPLSSGLILIPFYLIASNLTKNKLIITFASLSPFLLPVVASESLITRPQLLFMISLPIAVFLLQELILSSNYKNGWWLLSLLLGSGVALKIHELFALQLILVAIASFYFYRHTIKKNPLESATIIISLVILSIPWLRDFGLIEPLNDIAQRSIRILGKAELDWWFIDNYTNVDGNQLGWPDYTWIFYYGYNLGIVLPIVLLINRPRKLFAITSVTWLALIGALLFFVIAEILPRFGLAYLPDRAMLFFSLLAAFSLPYLLVKQSKLNQVIIYLAIVLSIVASWGLTWAKQGRVSPSQAQVAEFIKEKTDPGAVIIAQGGASPWVRYFAQRQWFKIPRSISSNPESQDSLMILRALADTNQQIKQFDDLSETLIDSMQLQFQNYKQVDSPSDRESLIEKIRLLHRRHELNEQAKELFIDQNYPSVREVYLLYSTDFFDSLYGKRAWWRNQNLYGLDLDKFNIENFELIYDESGEKLWRIETEQL